MGNCLTKKLNLLRRIRKRELGPWLYDRKNDTFVREILPLQTWIENGLMYSKPLEMIDRNKYIRKLLKSENITSEHENNSYSSSKKIPGFVDFYKIKMADFVKENPSDYATFNDFFIREVKPECRPIAMPDDVNVVVSAADCRLSVFDSVQQGHNLFVKGKRFSIEEVLLGGVPDQLRTKAESVVSWVAEDLSMANFRLSPMDYHRFHSPVTGTITDMYHIPGTYFTTEPKALQSDVNVLGENARTVVCIQTESRGRVLFIPVGAEAVGKVNMTVEEGDVVTKGGELGYFDYGGSDIIVIFENAVTWDSDIYSRSHGFPCVETLVCANEQIGTFEKMDEIVAADANVANAADVGVSHAADVADAADAADADAGAADAADAADADAGAEDAGAADADAGAVDAGAADADAGAVDAGDSGVPDAAVAADAGAVDANAGTANAGAVDADAGTANADAGAVDVNF